MAERESFCHKIRRAEQVIRQHIFRLFVTQIFRVVSVFVSGRHGHTQPRAFFLYHFVGELGVGVGAFQKSRDAQRAGGLQSAQGTHRPGVDYVNLADQLFELAGDEAVVQRPSPFVTEQFVRQPKFSPGQRRVDAHAGRQRPANGTG